MALSDYFPFLSDPYNIQEQSMQAPSIWANAASEILTPQAQFQRQMLESMAPLGLGSIWSQPRQMLEQSAMRGFQPAYGEYLLTQPFEDIASQMGGGLQTFPEFMQRGQTAGGINPLDRFAQLADASRMIPNLTTAQEGQLASSGLLPILQDTEASRAIMRAALGGPTAGKLGQLNVQREQNMWDLFNRMAIQGQLMGPEEYLGWGGGMLPTTSWGNIPTDASWWTPTRDMTRQEVMDMSLGAEGPVDGGPLGPVTTIDEMQGMPSEIVTDQFVYDPLEEYKSVTEDIDRAAPETSFDKFLPKSPVEVAREKMITTSLGAGGEIPTLAEVANIAKGTTILGAGLPLSGLDRIGEVAESLYGQAEPLEETEAWRQMSLGADNPLLWGR